MSIFDIFKTAPAQPATTATPAAPATPGNTPANGTTGSASTGAAPNGVVPPNTNTGDNANAGDGASTTPLDQFKDLWEPNKNADGTPITTEQPTGVFGELDPKKFAEVAQKLDFSKMISAEELQKIAAGGEEAAKTFAQSLNRVAQQVYAQSAYASTHLTEKAVAKIREQIIADLPAHVKRHAFSENLRSENPVFSNPAITPLITALERQLATKYPQASQAELTQKAKDYIQGVGLTFAPKPPEDKSKPAVREEDWEEFLK